MLNIRQSVNNSMQSMGLVKRSVSGPQGYAWGSGAPIGGGFSISKSWYQNWVNLITLFDHPDEIRKIIYTTNAIESLNSVIRKSIKKPKIFPNDNSAVKIIYLAIEQASRRWSMPFRNWKPAMNRFAIEYEGRFDY